MPRHRPDPALEAQLATALSRSVLERLFRVARKLDERALERLATRPGRPRLRRAHTALLPHLSREGIRVSALAARLAVTKKAVSQLLDDLEAFGAVERVPDPDDARARLVRLTRRGHEGLLDGLEVLAEEEAALRRAVGDEVVDALDAALRRVEREVDPARASG